MSSKNAVTFIVAGVACSVLSIVAILLTARVLGPLPLTISQTTTNKQSTFDVTGMSEISVVPDNAEVTVGLEVVKPKVAEAQIQVNQVMSDLTTKLKAMGIDPKDIKTENYSVNPNYDYTAGSQKTNGYRVHSSLLINVKQFDKINSIIDTATAAGATEVGNVNFTLSTEKELDVKKQARKEAIDKAKHNAEELSGLAGMRLGKIVNVMEDIPYSPIMFDAKADLSRSTGELNQATNIEAGSSIYRYNITLSYETM